MQEFLKRNVSSVNLNNDKFKVGILGAGGLGSNICVMLARSGIKNIHIVDYDEVDISNLNRQYYTLEDVGNLKVEALKKQILKINPNINIFVQNIKVDSNNIKEIFEYDDIICEALDDADLKMIVSEEILSDDKGKILISSSGMAGISNADNIKTRKMLNNWYVCGDESSDMENVEGMMAPRVMICAAHQANLVLRIIAGVE